MTAPTILRHDVVTPRLRLHVRAAGPPEGPLVVLLHGFPEHGGGWHRQLNALAGAGFRAVAPDLRGYGGSDREGPYDLDTVTADVDALVAALGRERATVVGHDWGAALAWSLASRRASRVERLVIVNGPHPVVQGRELRRNGRQRLRSAYIAAFLVPWLPERLLAARRAFLVERLLLAATWRRDAWRREDLDDYRATFSDVRVVRAALGWYRAAARRPRRSLAESEWPPVGCPTLIVWGLRDPSLGPELVAPDRLAPLFRPGVVPTVVRLPDVGHFVHHEAPDALADALLAFLGSPAPPRDGRDQGLQG